MPRRPGDTGPEPPGGRAAERLREFTEQRFPGETPAPLPCEAEKDERGEAEPAKAKPRKKASQARKSAGPSAKGRRRS
jgi:hypothetical protein